MRILLICFTDKYSNTELQLEKNYLYSLNQNSVYPDKTVLISGEDSQSFSSLILENYDTIFIANPKLAKFSVNEILSKNQIELNENGFYCGEKFVSLICENVSDEIEAIMAKMAEHYSIYHEKVVFKLFGLENEKIYAVTDQISQKYPSCFFHTKTEGLNSKTVLVFDSRAPKVEVDKAIKEFLITFKNNVYAEDDVSIESQLLNLLKLRRLTISTAESMTGGLIASKIVSVEGASQFFYEGLVTYNTKAKEERLGVSHSSITTFSVVSSEVAFEMAKGLLETGKCNVAISITGYASENAECVEKSGLCYIGIGVNNAIEVYEYKFNGTRKEVIEQATNASLFLALKTITNI